MRRLLLIPFGILLGLVALEVGLQAAALLFVGSDRRLPDSWLTGNRRVICLGDSNTYGIYLRDRSEAYPQQLEALWNARPGAPRIEVLNLGYPGTNTSRLRREFRRMLGAFAPETAIVMVGANDYWTTPVAVEDPRDVGGRIADVFARWSRTYQLIHMLRRASDGSRFTLEQGESRKDGGDATLRVGDEEFRLGWEKARSRIRGYQKPLRENLRDIARAARDSGTRLVFMTYPSRMWNYGEASEHIRAVASAENVRLVDLAAAFDPLCPKEPCPEVILADHHPSARGYRLIAETLVAELGDDL